MHYAKLLKFYYFSFLGSDGLVVWSTVSGRTTIGSIPATVTIYLGELDTEKLLVTLAMCPVTTDDPIFIFWDGFDRFSLKNMLLII